MAAKQEFESRFAKHKDELEWLFMELYHNREGQMCIRDRGVDQIALEVRRGHEAGKVFEAYPLAAPDAPEGIRCV